MKTNRNPIEIQKQQDSLYYLKSYGMDTLIVSGMNVTNFCIARGCNYGINNGWDYLVSDIPLRGTGKEKIRKLITTNDPYGKFSWYTKNETMIEWVVEAIDIARKLVIRDREEWETYKKANGIK